LPANLSNEGWRTYQKKFAYGLLLEGVTGGTTVPARLKLLVAETCGIHCGGQLSHLPINCASGKNRRQRYHTSPQYCSNLILGPPGPTCRTSATCALAFAQKTRPELFFLLPYFSKTFHNRFQIMVYDWIPLTRYKLLHASEDSESSGNSRAHCMEWLAFRRVRTALIAVALLTVVFIFYRLLDLSPHIRSVGEATPHTPTPDTSSKIQWNHFAYVQYVTNANYLCNSLMILEALHRAGTRADRIIMYPRDWHVSNKDETDASDQSKLLAKARDVYRTKLVPIQVQTFAKGDPTWKDSYTKLLAFNQTQYKRLISLDSDATVQDVGVPDIW